MYKVPFLKVSISFSGKILVQIRIPTLYLVLCTLYFHSIFCTGRSTLVSIPYFVFRISYFLSLPIPLNRIALDLHYLPCLEYFTVLRGVDELFLFPGDRYERQSYFNRTSILLANKVQTLSVPIQGRRPRISLAEVRIDSDQKWVSNHLRGIQSGYGKAPFFEYFFPYFEEALSRQETQLWNLNLELLTICLKLLRWPVKLTLVGNEGLPEDVIDLRGQILPSSTYLDRVFYQPVAYPQLFGLDFASNLSVLDLLFCMGTESDKILGKSQKIQEQ